MSVTICAIVGMAAIVIMVRNTSRAETFAVCPYCNRRHGMPYCRRPVNRIAAYYRSDN